MKNKSNCGASMKPSQKTTPKYAEGGTVKMDKKRKMDSSRKDRSAERAVGKGLRSMFGGSRSTGPKFTKPRGGLLRKLGKMAKF